jgi:hypothetical protein
MYNREFWVDRTVDQNGNVVQKGTLQDQTHFNNMESGIDDASIASKIMMFKSIQEGYKTADEVQTVTLAMSDLPWPFNNKETTVALNQVRNTTSYSVDIDVLEYSGGRLGNIRAADRALNGFKLIHDGSATNVQVKVKVSGGMEKEG